MTSNRKTWVDTPKSVLPEVIDVYQYRRSRRSVQAAVAQALSDETLAQACQAEGMRWYQTVLNPMTTLKLFLLQILHGNTAMTHLRHLSRLLFTASAYCQARGKIPLAVCQGLLKGLTQSAQEVVAEVDGGPGHRLYYVDGSSFSMPDSEALQAHFGQPGGQQPGCGFPVAHFLALSDAATGLITEVLTAPLRTHDMSGMVELHPQLQPGDVLVADRGFCSFAHLALLAQRGAEMVVRVHQRQIVDFTPTAPISSPAPTPRCTRVGLVRAGLRPWEIRTRWSNGVNLADGPIGYRPNNLPRYPRRSRCVSCATESHVLAFVLGR